MREESNPLPGQVWVSRTTGMRAVVSHIGKDGQVWYEITGFRFAYPCSPSTWFRSMALLGGPYVPALQDKNVVNIGLNPC